MKRLRNPGRLALGACALALACGAQAWAHHSQAMFDPGRSVQLEGTVKEFQWTNPHIWIELTVTEGGQAVQYSIEGGSPVGLIRRGWTRSSLKAGDHIKLIMHPLRDGSHGGNFVSATLPDGHVIGDAGYGA